MNNRNDLTPAQQARAHAESERKEHRRLQFENRDQFFSLARKFFLAAVFLGLFSFIYEKNSHGVYTPYMTLLALIPFLLGCLPAFLMGVIDAVSNTKIIRVDEITRMFWGLGVLTLSLGSALQGALVIYGTSSPYMIVYPIAGGLLMALFVGFLIAANRRPFPGSAREKMKQETPALSKAPAGYSPM